MFHIKDGDNATYADVVGTHVKWNEMKRSLGHLRAHIG